MMSKTIAISGTPGTGKTTLAEYWVKKLGYYHLKLHYYYKQISTGYNRSKQCYDIDLKKFERLIKAKVKEHGTIIIDSHISHLLSRKLIDLCVVLVCSNLKKLEKRLKKKKYSKKKVRENLDAEIFQVCLNEAKEKGHKLLVIDISRDIDTSKRVSKKEMLKKLNLE